MRIVLVLGAVLLVAAGLWWAAASSGDPSGGAPEPVTSETAPAAPAAQPSATAEPAPPSKASPSPQPPPTAAPVPTSEPAQPPAAEPAPAVEPVPPPAAQGPVDKLKERFASEPRDSGANAVESRIQAAFRDPAIPAGVLGSVLCHKTVCKLEIRWTEDHNTPYMLGLSHLLPDMATDLAISPAGSRDPAGVIPLEVYWGRKPDPTP
jgi:hypothetical protein